MAHKPPAAASWCACPGSARSTRSPIRDRAMSMSGAAPSTSGRSLGGFTTPSTACGSEPSGKAWKKIPTKGGGGLIVANHAGRHPFRCAGDHARHRDRARQRAVYGLADHFFKSHPGAGHDVEPRSGGVVRPPRERLPLTPRSNSSWCWSSPRGLKGSGQVSTDDPNQLRRSGGADSWRSPCGRGCPIVPIAVVGAEESMPIVDKDPDAVPSASERALCPLSL